MNDQEIRDLSEILELYENLSANQNRTQDEQDNLDMAEYGRIYPHSVNETSPGRGEEIEAKRKAIDDLNKIIDDLAKALSEWVDEVIKMFESRGEKMIKRTCPLCGHPWYSSVEQDPWHCQNCGFLLTPDMNEYERSKDAENAESQSDCLS